MLCCGLINRENPPRQSVWQSWQRARIHAQRRAIRTGDVVQLEWLERVRGELEMGLVS